MRNWCILFCCDSYTHFRARCYANAGTSYGSVSVSVTSRCFVKTDERIELVFGETASQCQIFYYEKLMCMPTKLDGTSSGEGDYMGRRMSGNQGWKTLVLTNVLVFKFKKVLNICKFFGFLNFMFCKALLGVAYLRCRHFVN